MDSFIVVWLGTEYVLPHSVLVVILANFFISQFRGTNDQFIYGYGLFQDTWAPIATLGITILAALVGGYYWGLPGVLLGDVASSITVISIWKPYFYIATVLKCLLEFIGKCIAVFMYVCFFLGFDRWYSFIIGSAKTRGRLFRVELVCFGFFVIISVDFDNSIL